MLVQFVFTSVAYINGESIDECKQKFDDLEVFSDEAKGYQTEIIDIEEYPVDDDEDEDEP